MPRTNEGADYLATLLTSPFTYGAIGSHGPLLFAVSENADPISSTDVTPWQSNVLDVGMGTGIDGVVSHTSGASSFVIISPDTLVSAARTVFKLALFVDPSDGDTVPTDSLIYHGMLTAPVYVVPGDHDMFAMTVNF